MNMTLLLSVSYTHLEQDAQGHLEPADLLLRLSLGFFFGERLLHIKDSLRKEACLLYTSRCV